MKKNVHMAVFHLREALWIAEQHVDAAVGRRLTDYRKSVEHVVEALSYLEGKPINKDLFTSDKRKRVEYEVAQEIREHCIQNLLSDWVIDGESLIYWYKFNEYLCQRFISNEEEK